MAPVIPELARIRSFATASAFEKWLRIHHDREPEVWLRIYKKGSATATVTHVQALDVALCWGWIDGLRKGYDDVSFLQRFTPRRAKSIWSQVNREHVARLTAEGRMQEPGQKQVDAAKADGRWDAAYAPIRSISAASIPDDLRAAIEANADALRTFRTLGRMNLFALTFRTNNMKTAAGRARKIAALVEMLARGETIVPERPALSGRARSPRVKPRT
ncbi:MAG: YdeI/OmpD-associated family protein [Acidobacteria bacterium]|nr:YdeI/OmpD-associated family protein [Acidobacteriota bacterium]